MELMINGHIERFSIDCKDCGFLEQRIVTEQYMDAVTDAYVLDDEWVPDDIEEIRDFSVGLDCNFRSLTPSHNANPSGFQRELHGYSKSEIDRVWIMPGNIRRQGGKPGD